MAAIELILFAMVFGQFCHGLEMHNGGYDGLAVAIEDSVPSSNCKLILDNLEEMLTSASQYLFSALDAKAFFRTITIRLPSSWPESCIPKGVLSNDDDQSDVTILPEDGYRGKLWTQQSLGCGQPGDQIYLSYGSLESKDFMLGRSFVKEFAKYRYGIFDERGFKDDPVYPMCFQGDKNKIQVTGCSDFPIQDNGICDGTANEYNVSKMVDSKARTSIMFAAESPSVYMFCDEGNHDPYAPTKQNLICHGKSTYGVIKSHEDFHATIPSKNFNETTPTFQYKKRTITRYVLIIENTRFMLEQQSWEYLRSAARKWILVDMPRNSEVALVLTAHDEHTIKKTDFPSISTDKPDDSVPAAIPYTPKETSDAPCIHCGIKTAIDMLLNRTREAGDANKVIVLIAAGMDDVDDMTDVLDKAKRSNIKIVTINYPKIVRTRLDQLAHETGGVAYTIMEKKVNVQDSSLTTYFQLTNIFQNIIEKFYVGNINDLPIEIHRREIKANSNSLLVIGNFFVEETMGEPAKFFLYTHKTTIVLIENVELISPSRQVYSIRSDDFMVYNLLSIKANISENGTWVYNITWQESSLQPYFLQVLVTPKSITSPIVRGNFRVYRQHSGSPLILLVEVKRGTYPVLGAKVEVVVSKTESNGSIGYSETFELLDTGSGDPDITKGDGVYTRYYSAARGGPGVYTFQVVVSDNGNNAYTWKTSFNYNNKACCGSTIEHPKEEVLPFQRTLPPITMEISSADIQGRREIAGRILDLKSKVKDGKAQLIWTAPDMGGQDAQHYEIKYAYTLSDIVDRFEINAMSWPFKPVYHPRAGSEISFTLDISNNTSLLDKPLYFAVKATPQLSSLSTISNWVRIFVPSPPLPPTVPPTQLTSDFSFWNYDNYNNVGIDPIRPSTTTTSSLGVEMIIVIIVVCIVLLAVAIVAIRFCILKYRQDINKKSIKTDSLKHDKINSNITIVPSSPLNNPQTTPLQSYSNQVDEPDHHTIGVPVGNYGYDDDTKKRYSLVQHQEQQLIDELKQQQQHMAQQLHPQGTIFGGLSVISNGTIPRNQPTLSPFNSWSASQLLHEHERRHSPLENMMQDEQLLPQHQEVMNQIDHMSLNGQHADHISLSSHHQIPDHYTTANIPPPVPPLPMFNPNGYPANYSLYGVHHAQTNPINGGIYQTMQRSEQLGQPFNPSLQGSLNSVNSGEKKRRNVTMV